MQKVVLLFEGRTGSSLLIGLLNQCEGLCFAGEEIAAHKADGWSGQRRWLDGFFDLEHPFPARDRRTRHKSRDVLGFKVKLRDLADPAALAEYLRDQGAQVVRLRRDNPVKQALSAIRAMDLEARHGLYNLPIDQASKTPGRYAISLERFDRILQRYLTFEANLDTYMTQENLHPVLTVSYEALTSDMRSTVANFCEHFGVAPPQDLQATLVKLTDDDMSQVIDNYDELLAFYRDGPLAQYF